MAALFTAGCSINLFDRGQSGPAPQPLIAAPSGTVTGTTLPPPDGSADTTGASPSGLAALSTPETGADATTTPPPAGTSEIGRTDLLGGWTINAPGETCQLFMTLTTWAGGYRASTRGCTNASFQGISAWNIEAGQIQLFNDAGTTVARLYPASKSQLDGQSAGGGPMSVSR